MKNFLVKVWDWIVWSSKDPEKVSLTVKGVLTGILPGVIFLSGLAHVQLPSDDLTKIIEGLAVFIQTFFGGVAALTVVVGLLRKLISTVVGTNALINKYYR